jgi:hypothetical protein
MAALHIGVQIEVDGTRQGLVTLKHWHCARPPPSCPVSLFKNKIEEAQKDKNIQQAGFPDGHPL